MGKKGRQMRKNVKFREIFGWVIRQHIYTKLLFPFKKHIQFGVGRKQKFGLFRRTQTFWVLNFLLY